MGVVPFRRPSAAPTPVEAAFERYAKLVRQVDAEPALRLDLPHNIEMARAWRDWCDLYLAQERAS